ncbi:MAG: UrcA family protein [Thermaurantiacus sp.]
MNTTLAIAGAILCASMTSTVAWASDAAPARTVAVQTADLNLSTPAGQRTLDRRIRSAVKEVCGDPSSLVRGGRQTAMECRAETLAAVAQQRGRMVAAATGQAAFVTLK